MTIKQFVRGVVLFGLYGFSAVTWAVLRYTIQPVPFGDRLNDNGEIAGNKVIDVAGHTHAFLWRNGAEIDLGALGAVSNSTSTSSIVAINNKGQVAGMSPVLDNNGEIVPHGFLWTNSVMQDLGSFGLGSVGDTISVVALNDNGQVLLSRAEYVAIKYQWVRIPYVWTNGQLTKVDGLFNATAINASGQVVGINSDGYVAIWRNGELTSLNSHQYRVSPDYPLSLNDQGEVSGSIYDVNSETSEVFSWLNGGMIRYGAKDIVPESDRNRPNIFNRSVYAVKINAKGDAGGVLSPVFSYSTRGDIYYDDGAYPFIYNGLGVKMIPLLGYYSGRLSGNRGSIEDINDDGAIVGSSSGIGSPATNEINSELAVWSNMRAYIYKDGVTTDLNALIPANSGLPNNHPDLFVSAQKINNQGQILVMKKNYTYALLTPASDTPKASCDANHDQKVDTRDLTLIYANMPKTNTNAPVFNPAYDVDGDSKITVKDVRKCVTKCNKPKCAA